MDELNINQNYTLEKHLKFLSEKDKDYELLYSIWDLNKRNLNKGLNLISASYPHYSMHDYSHSITIMDNIQSYLGEERIKRLGITDTFLILMASLTHDIGMILSYKILEKEWEKNGFKSALQNFSESEDSVISKSAKLIINFKTNNKPEDSFKWALEIKNAVTVITAEIFRSRHASQSADYLINDDDFKNLAENFYSDQLPSRFINLLADVAFLHGQDFDNVLSHLYQKADGFKGDYIRPIAHFAG